jgi:hypothetical protein
MAFQQFTFPQVLRDLGLSLADADLFAAVPPALVRPEFAELIIDNANLAGAINTEKARSEFVVAPVLIELRRTLHGSFGLFSGVELDADASRGLNGVCDFLITRSPVQHVVTQPILPVVEAKNENLRSGLGQCIASMVAAQILDKEAADEAVVVHGAVTIGSVWKFLRLIDTGLTVDLVEYHIDNLGMIMGILSHIVSATP